MSVWQWYDWWGLLDTFWHLNFPPQTRTSYLVLTKLVLKNSNYKEFYHRQEELFYILRSIADEEADVPEDKELCTLILLENDQTLSPTWVPPASSLWGGGAPDVGVGGDHGFIWRGLNNSDDRSEGWSVSSVFAVLALHYFLTSTCWMTPRYLPLFTAFCSACSALLLPYFAVRLWIIVLLRNEDVQIGCSKLALWHTQSARYNLKYLNFMKNVSQKYQVHIYRKQNPVLFCVKWTQQKFRVQRMLLFHNLVAWFSSKRYIWFYIIDKMKIKRNNTVPLMKI